MEKNKHKNNASILIISMVILGAILVMGLNLALVSVKEKKISISSDDSNIAYQLAEQGVEEIMQKLLSVSLVAPLAGIFDDECEDGKIIRQKTDGIYEISFFKYDGDGNQVVADCSDEIGDVISIKSIGTLSNERQKRAVQAPVIFDKNAECILLACQDIQEECTTVDDEIESGCPDSEFLVCPCGDVSEVCYENSCCTPVTCTAADCGTTIDRGCGLGNQICLPCCEDECSPSGFRQCSGAGYHTCGNYDTDTCLEWSGVTPCTYGCTNGVCNSCTPIDCAGRCGSVDDGCEGTIWCERCPTLCPPIDEWRWERAVGGVFAYTYTSDMEGCRVWCGSVGAPCCRYRTDHGLCEAGEYHQIGGDVDYATYCY